MYTRIKPIALTLTVAALFGPSAPVHARNEPSKSELVSILKRVDENQHNTGDFRSDTYMEQKEKESSRSSTTPRCIGAAPTNAS